MEIINYKKDPLLSRKKIFICGIVNLYGALIRKEDMQKNKKGEVLKKCPYVLDKDNEIYNILKKLKNKNFLKVRSVLSKYLQIKSVRKDTFYGWLKKNMYPLPLIRVACFLNKENILNVLKNKIITNFCKSSKIKLPSLTNDLNSDFIAYFLGLHLGDGTLNKERWKIADGDMEEKNLRYSYEFLNKIKNNLKKIFSISHSKIYKIKKKNAYELIVVNKWFGRYLNFVYGIEQKEKENPLIPKVLKNKKELVLRGLFDTDGSIKNYRIIIGSKYKKIYREIEDILKKHKIEYKKRINNTQRGNPFYILEIKKEFIVKFIKTIGFSHPRKIEEIKKYLLTTSHSRDFKRYKKEYKPKVSEKKFLELCQYIRPIKNAGKVRFISEFNKLNQKERERVVKNFRKNFEISKSPNYKNYVYSYRIERILTNYCIYKRKRNKTEDNQIKEITEKLKEIWD